MPCCNRPTRGLFRRVSTVWPVGLVCLAAGLVSAPTVWGQVGPGVTALETGCVDESNGLSNNCTANDLTFVQLGLGVQRDGCVNSSDRVKIFLRGALQNSTAQARYDVGLWFPREDPVSGTIDPEGDGAQTGVCYLAGLMNPEPVTPTDACLFDTPVGALDLVGGSGPWVNAESAGANDACGDIYANASSTTCDANPADGNWDDSIIWVDLTPDGIEISCDDDDGNGVADGFVNMPVCLSWGNQQNQVDNDGNTFCDNMTELQPGTKSKCRCEPNQATDIPAPDLSLACTMPTGFTTVRPGEWVTVSVTYTNNCSCTPDTNPLVADRFKCCTASYVQFPIAYNSTYGSITNIDRPTEVVDDGMGTLLWTPVSASVSPGTGIIAQSETATLTFDYVVDPGAPDPGSDFVGVSTAWADDVGFTTTVSQAALQSTCNVAFNSTWASVTDVDADVRDGFTTVSWESSAEVGTVGFDVFRSNPGNEGWAKANETLIPALGEGPGGRYQFVDSEAPVDGVVTYKIREVDAWGEELETRPVTVELRDVSARAPRSRVSRQLRKPSARVVKNLENSARRLERTKSGATMRRVRGGSPTRAERPTVVKIGVAETGLYRISAAEIAASLDASVSDVETKIRQNKLALSTGGRPVGWLAEADSGGLKFFGQAPESIFSSERIYMLMVGKGLTINEADATPPPPVSTDGFFVDTVSFERDLLMRPFNVVDGGEDFWFWDLVLADDPTYGERTLEFELAEVAAYNVAAQLKIGVLGFAPATRIRGSVFLNDAYVGEIHGPILVGTETSFDLAQSDLVNGTNTVRVVGRLGGMLIDGVEVTYGRSLRAVNDELAVHDLSGNIISIEGFTNFAVDVFDVSDPLQPSFVPSNKTVSADGQSVVVSFEQPTPGGAYFALGSGTDRSPVSLSGRAKSEIRANWTGAEHVIITTSDLVSAAERLADHRREHGLESIVVDIEDIFDDFADGERDPGAVKAFLTYAVDHWATVPKYIVLAGRGHYDYKDLMEFGGNLVPPMLFATERGLVPSDNLMADVNDDGVPDVAIGRLPVLSAEELETVVDKIITYEGEAPGSWSRKVMLAADDPDDAGEFPDSVNKMALAVPEDRVIEKVFLSDPSSVSEVTGSLLGALDDGIEAVNWTGHAGLDSLADERVLEISHLDQLAGTPHPTIFVGLTCLLNNFGFQWFATLGEELAVLPGGGAIAVWSAAGLSSNDHAEELGESFMAALGSDEPQRLGDIIQSAVAGYMGPYSDNDLINEYVLFGDPGLELK